MLGAARKEEATPLPTIQTKATKPKQTQNQDEATASQSSGDGFDKTATRAVLHAKAKP